MMNIENFPYFEAIVAFSVLVYLFDSYVDYRQRKMYAVKEMPSALKSIVDKEKFRNAQAYGLAKASLSFYRGIINFALSMAVFKYSLIARLWAWAEQLLQQWGGVAQPADHEIWTALVFVVLAEACQLPLRVPLDLYAQFVVEERFGFNKQTLGGWLSDFIKQQAVSAALGLPILAGLLSLVLWAGDQFWIYGWLFLAVVMLIMLTIYPTVIAPLFNKFENLPEGELRTSIAALAKRIDFPLTEMYTMDQSTRSSHSNAYFYGLWYNKRIVLFDTLMKQCDTERIVAIVGHEMGHYKRSHMAKNLVVIETYLAVFLFLFGQAMNNAAMFRAFGFHQAQPAMIGLVIFSMLFEPVEHVIGVAQRFMSRKFEYEADQFAVDLGLDIGTALKNIHSENLATMLVDPLYSACRLTHPHLTERLAAINNLKGKKK